MKTPHLATLVKYRDNKKPVCSRVWAVSLYRVVNETLQPEKKDVSILNKYPFFFWSYSMFSFEFEQYWSNVWERTCNQVSFDDVAPHERILASIMKSLK